MARSRLIECGWRTGKRTACPVLVDNLSGDAVDSLWGDISRVNWKNKAEERWAAQMMDGDRPSGSGRRRASRSRAGA